MNISRHNYEEYFILYMDNELAAGDRQAVEAFVLLHPDLKDELDMLLQFKLAPDTNIVFNGKEELIKINGETPVSLSNYEEWMVLYTDNELNAEQQLSFEQFMIAHPSLRQELEQFQQARLEPGTIIFAGKPSLYRKEERTRRIGWWRIAAAAVLLIAIGITAVTVINNNKTKNGGIVKDNTPVIRSTEKIPVINPPVPNKENIAVNNQPGEKISPVTQQPSRENNMIVKQAAPLKKENIRDVIIPEEQKEEQVVAVKKNNDLPTPINNPNVINNSKVDVAIANHIPAESIQSKEALTKQKVTTDDPGSSNIKTAAYPESDPGIDTDTKKNKGRGLFRKIARTFEKRTSIDPTDDNRLLIAGLAIKLK